MILWSVQITKAETIEHFFTAEAGGLKSVLQYFGAKLPSSLYCRGDVGLMHFSETQFVQSVSLGQLQNAHTLVSHEGNIYKYSDITSDSYRVVVYYVRSSEFRYFI
jgi:hypothetical protein